MTTSQQTVDFILEQMSDAGRVSARRMFGGYCVYCDGKVVALICEDELFVKRTEVGEKYFPNCSLKPPYRGAKPHLHIEGERWEDRDWLSELIRMTVSQLPELKVKKPRKNNQ